MDDFDQHCPFIPFARAILAEPELHPSVHHLQHQSGFNTNIILYLLWLAKARYGRLTKKQIQLAQSQILLWHQRVIAELKYTHALVAEISDPVAINIKRALQNEIMKAHVIEQKMLFETKLKVQVLRRSFRQQLVDAAISIMHYCELKNDPLFEEDQFAFLQLFCFVFNESDRLDIEKQIKKCFSQIGTILSQPAQMMWEEF
ncbi:MAG: hypothetical protein COY58_03170 [Gammaproteobacteria bacterium CG_4_10_14_0_8_um_filter_38_16]|nr:MAG: hypothetical protein COY58_03170 [Gammaproteobacteria bacterium CG_4_10_14_0_8_um_filter_38_16]PJA03927.1 MAG: hypothetical protein COX72_03330 [Gammaproteobacteria bacterium CG_4_10_14_0_2_um_filter_38_22]PJB09746.1 MAG: hypothetical protein CO120_08560 [Gammaproteobacteria bacterium CG_4_9_14_3_um_filter_38_9]